MKRLIGSAVSLLMVAAMLTSCTNSNTGLSSSQNPQTSSAPNLVADSDNTEIVNIFNSLTDDSMKGRLAGTKENKQAGQLIEDYFKKIGLSPYQNNNYYHEYTAPYYSPYNPEDMSLKLTIDNKTTTLEFAKDYLADNTADKTALKLKVTNDKSVKNKKTTHTLQKTL